MDPSDYSRGYAAGYRDAQDNRRPRLPRGALWFIIFLCTLACIWIATGR